MTPPIFSVGARDVPGDSTIDAANIPVLTDVLEVLSAESVTVSPVEQQNLEIEIRETVLHSLQTHVDAVLDAYLQEAMTQILAHYVQVLQTDLKMVVRDTLKEVITRTVTQELSRGLAQKISQKRS